MRCLKHSRFMRYIFRFWNYQTRTHFCPAAMRGCLPLRALPSRHARIRQTAGISSEARLQNRIRRLAERHGSFDGRDLTGNWILCTLPMNRVCSNYSANLGGMRCTKGKATLAWRLPSITAVALTSRMTPPSEYVKLTGKSLETKLLR